MHMLISTGMCRCFCLFKRNTTTGQDCHVIDELRLQLAQNEDERNLLRESLHEIESELRRMSDEHTTALSMNEEQLTSLINERDALVELQILQTMER
jgi:hypothetical protein